MVGVRPGEETAARGFLTTFNLQGLEAAVAERAVRIRQERRIRLSDAVIEATARARGEQFVARNSKDFPRDHPGIRIPAYRCQPLTELAWLTA